MLEEKEQLLDNIEDLDKAIDESTALLPLNAEEQQIVQNIVQAPSQQVLQEQFDLFNINQAKINALRVIKLNNLLGKIEDQAIERFEKRPGEISNKELLDYMQVVSSQIDRSTKYVETIKEKPAIIANPTKTEVNINLGDTLDRDGKERVIDAIQMLLKQVKNPVTSEDVVDADFTTPKVEEPVESPISEENKNTE